MHQKKHFSSIRPPLTQLTGPKLSLMGSQQGWANGLPWACFHQSGEESPNEQKGRSHTWKRVNLWFVSFFFLKLIITYADKYYPHMKYKYCSNINVTICKYDWRVCEKDLKQKSYDSGLCQLVHKYNVIFFKILSVTCVIFIKYFTLQVNK